MNKRGQILQSSTIKWILLIVVAVVLLFFVGIALYSVLVVGPRACHYSIVFRSTFSYGALNFLKDAIPIKCQEQKICFNIGGECSMFGDTKGIKEIDVDGKTDEEIKLHIYKELADMHYEAHKTVGEGKLDFLPSNFQGPSIAWDKFDVKRFNIAELLPEFKKSYYCIIYSVFDFDDELKEKAKNGFKLNWIDFYRFLEDNPAPNNKETGLHYLYGINNIASIDTLLKEIYKTDTVKEEDKIKTFDWDISGIDLGDGKGKNTQYAILIKATKGNVWSEFLSKPDSWVSLGAFAGSFIKIGKVGIPFAGLIRKGAVVYGGIQFTRAIGDAGMVYSPPSIVQNKAQAYEESWCGEFPFSP